MTVYVDNQNAYGRIVRGSRTVTGMWSRLLADDAAELTEFALNLGLPPEWARAPGTPGECYDIGDLTRRRAIAAGAVPITYPRGTGKVIATKTLQAAALDAAGRGWHVFPLRPGSKVPAIRDWEHEATTDPDRVRRLWTAGLQLRDGWFVPEPHNVGVACGPSGLVVLDLDVPKTDDRSGWAEHWRSREVTSGGQILDALAEQAGQTVPDTYAVATPSGGRHLYFAAPDAVPVRNSAGRVGPMVDIRGEGGYVVAPGSRIHPHYYEPHVEDVDLDQLTYRLTDDRQPVTLPGWLADAASTGPSRDDEADLDRRPEQTRGRLLGGRSDSYGAAALRGEVDWVRSAPVGQRNHRLNGAAYSLGQLVAADVMDRDRVVTALTDAAQSAGLTVSEIAATIHSGLTAGAKNPRVLPPARTHHNTESGRSQAGLEQPEQAVETRQAPDRADAGADLDRVFGLEPVVAVPIVAGLIIDAPPGERPALLRDAATWIARLVDDDGIDGQYALDALSDAALRIGMTRTEIDTAVADGFTRSVDPPDLADRAAGDNADQTDRSATDTGPAEQPYRIDEVDAAYAGWLFAEAWDSWSTDREPCYPADTLRVACEWEGLPTLGTSHHHPDRPRPPAPFIPAPGEELDDRDIYHSWSQAQTDAWHASQADRRRVATTGQPISRPIPDSSPQSEVVAQASPAAEKVGDIGRPRDGSALSQPVDADALVRSLLAVLQSRGVIDRTDWDTVVTDVAERAAAALPHDASSSTAIETESVNDRDEPPAGGATDPAPSRTGHHPDAVQDAADEAGESRRLEAVRSLLYEWAGREVDDRAYAMYRELVDALNGPDFDRADEPLDFDEPAADAQPSGPVHDPSIDPAAEADPWAAEQAQSVAAADPEAEPYERTPTPRQDPPAAEPQPSRRHEVASGEAPVAKPDAAPVDGPDRHQALDAAIGQARAAVEASRAASRDRARGDAADAARHDPPGYWAEPVVEL